MDDSYAIVSEHSAQFSEGGGVIFNMLEDIATDHHSHALGPERKLLEIGSTINVVTVDIERHRLVHECIDWFHEERLWCDVQTRTAGAIKRAKREMDQPMPRGRRTHWAHSVVGG